MTILTQEKLRYRVDSETEAEQLVTDLKEKQREEDFELTEHSIKVKTKKSKGEVVDLWYEVNVTKSYGGF